MKAPLWIVPGRVRVGVILPLNATRAQIEAEALKAAESSVTFATAEGYALVMPTARIRTEPTYDDAGYQDGIKVEAWCRVEQVSP